jgi:hypothetical protein
MKPVDKKIPWDREEIPRIRPHKKTSRPWQLEYQYNSEKDWLNYPYSHTWKQRNELYVPKGWYSAYPWDQYIDRDHAELQLKKDLRAGS